MSRSIALTVAAAAGAFLTPSTAFAQLDVAICAAASSSSTNCGYTDTQAKLLASGLFNTVDIINVTLATPTLVQLQAYDAVICWTNVTPQDTTAWGNALADYVDAGGGVVVAVFANSSTTTNRHIGGRWQTGYEVILDQSGNTSGNAALGNVLLPAHPIMSGVSTFFGGTSMFRPTVTALETGAFAIAEWNDGRVLVAQGANPRRVDIGFYPLSSDCSSQSWSTASDGALLMSNALWFAAGGASGCPTPTNYCTPSTTTSGCNPTMSSTGTPSVAASSGFDVTCNNVEGQKSGLLFYGISGTIAQTWGTGSTSFLCVKAPTQRLPAQNSGGTNGACDGVISADLLAYFAATPGSLGLPFSAGDVAHVQCWFRDPPAPKTTNLSDGLEVTFCP